MCDSRLPTMPTTGDASDERNHCVCRQPHAQGNQSTNLLSIIWRHRETLNSVSTALRQATQSGFVRAILGTPENRRTAELEKLNDSASPEEIFDNPIWIVVDRIVVGQTPDLRISESLETALYFGGGSTIVLSPSDSKQDAQTLLTPKQFSKSMAVRGSGRRLALH